MSAFVTIARIPELSVEGCREIRIQGRTIALFSVNGHYFALDSACPHKGGPLGGGQLEGHTVYCPLHGWAFDVRTGACENRPDKPAHSYPVRVMGEEIQVDLGA